MYLSLSCLFILGVVNFFVLGAVAEPGDVSPATQQLIVYGQALILIGIVFNGIKDWFSRARDHRWQLEREARAERIAKEKADRDHAERMELHRLQLDKIEENTELTKKVRVDVRHDVRGEVQAVTLKQKEVAGELADKVDADRDELLKRIDALRKEVECLKPTQEQSAPKGE